MTKEKLLEGIFGLPVIEVGAIAESGQIIEGNQGRVHYKLTRETIPFLRGLTLFFLSTSGPKKERLAFASEVIAELGEPFGTGESPDLPEIHMLSWEVNAVKKRLRRGKSD